MEEGGSVYSLTTSHLYISTPLWRAGTLGLWKITFSIRKVKLALLLILYGRYTMPSLAANAGIYCYVALK